MLKSDNFDEIMEDEKISPLFDEALHIDNNDSPGEVLGEWSIDIGNGYYYSLYVGDGCIDLGNGSSYWISAHVDTDYTQLIWLYTQAPFYTFARTTDNGVTWGDSEYGVSGAAAIWAEQIYYTDWQPAGSADVNLDGVTNILDVVQLVQYVLGSLEFTDEQIFTVNVNPVIDIPIAHAGNDTTLITPYPYDPVNLTLDGANSIDVDGYITSKMFEKLKMNMMLIYPYLHKQKTPQGRCVIII